MEREKLELFIAYLSGKSSENIEQLDREMDWEIRCPSQGEWYLSLDKKKIITTEKSRELLSDGTSSNHRGAMMDGRPRKFEGFGPMQHHKAAIETHPSKKEITAISSIPMDRDNMGVTVRFVISPIRKGDIVRVPANADVISNIKVELFWTFILGILPSFAIPILRGMGSYATEGMDKPVQLVARQDGVRHIVNMAAICAADAIRQDSYWETLATDERL